MILLKRIFLIPVLAVALIGCQKEEFMMSKDKIEKQIQSTWDNIEMSTSYNSADWKFSEGKVYLLNHDIVVADGNYHVDVSITKVKIKISDFPDPGFEYMNGTWQVLTLDDKILVMAVKDHGGTLQREFIKKTE